MFRCTMRSGLVTLALVSGMAGAQPARVGDLIDGLVWAEPKAGRAVIDRLIGGGKPAVRDLCALLKSPEEGADDSKARFALEGIVVTVMQDAKFPARAMVAEALAEAMGTATQPEVKAHLVRALARVGDDRAVPALAPLLADADLFEPAAQALVHIGSPAAGAALARALPGTEGGVRLTLIRALGQLRHAAPAETMLPLATDAHVQTRLAVWYALANCGVRAADPALKAGSADPDGFVRSRAVRARFLLAQRLAPADKGAAVGILRELAATPLTPATRQTLCAVLATLVDCIGEEAVPNLVRAAGGPDWQVREAAMKLAEELPAARIACLPLVQPPASPETRTAVVAMLGRSREPQGQAAVLGALADTDPTVRQVAAQASLAYGREGLDALLAYASRAVEAGDAAAAKSALLQIRDDGLTAKLGAALGGATPTGKQTLLAVLAERDAADQSSAVLAELASADRGVVKAALGALETIARLRDETAILDFFAETDSSASRSGARSVLVALCRRDRTAVGPLLAAQAKAQGKLRSEFLSVLARVGGPEALAAVQADLKSPEQGLRDAGVRALAEWQDVAAAPALLAIVRAAESEVHRILALRGYVRLAETAGAQAVPMLAQAAELAKTANDRKMVLGGLGNVRTEAALLLVAPYLDDEEVREEAAAAAVKIACPQGRGDKGLVSTKVAQVLGKVAAVSKNEAVVAKADSHLPNLPIAVDGENIAVGKPVTTSCKQQGDKAPWKAVDGKLEKDRRLVRRRMAQLAPGGSQEARRRHRRAHRVLLRRSPVLPVYGGRFAGRQDMGRPGRQHQERQACHASRAFPQVRPRNEGALHPPEHRQEQRQRSRPRRRGGSLLRRPGGGEVGGRAGERPEQRGVGQAGDRLPGARTGQGAGAGGERRPRQRRRLVGWPVPGGTGVVAGGSGRARRYRHGAGRLLQRRPTVLRLQGRGVGRRQGMDLAGRSQPEQAHLGPDRLRASLRPGDGAPCAALRHQETAPTPRCM